MDNFNFDIEKLINTDIKKAVAESKKKKEESIVEEDEDIEAPVEDSQEESNEDQDYSYEDDSDDEDEEQDDDSDDEEQEDDSDELDLSEEGIEALLNGKPKKKSKSKKEEPSDDTDLSEFTEDEDYQYLSSEFGEDDEVLSRVNSLLKKAKGSSILEKNKVVKELKEQVLKLKTTNEESSAELSQAQEILHAHRFDALPKVQEEYVKPIRLTQASIQKILDIDGTGINVRSVVDCKSIADLNEVLEKTTLSEDEERTVKQHWKRHRELVQNYVTDREDAKKNISKYIGSEISEDVKTRVFNKTLDKVLSDETFSYIKSWREDPEKEEVAEGMLNTAKKNFNILVNMISNPVENVRSDKSLSEIAKYVLDNVHYAQMAEQQKQLSETSKKDKETILKLAQRVKELSQDSGGLTGRPKGSGGRGIIKPSKTTSVGKLDKKESLNKFLQSKNKLTSLL